MVFSTPTKRNIYCSPVQCLIVQDAQSSLASTKAANQFRQAPYEAKFQISANYLTVETTQYSRYWEPRRYVPASSSLLPLHLLDRYKQPLQTSWQLQLAMIRPHIQLLASLFACTTAVNGGCKRVAATAGNDQATTGGRYCPESSSKAASSALMTTIELQEHPQLAVGNALIMQDGR